MVERTPAYIDRVRSASAAARAGLRADDLVLLAGRHLTQSCKSLRSELDAIDRSEPVKLTVLRGQELLEVLLHPGPDEP